MTAARQPPPTAALVVIAWLAAASSAAPVFGDVAASEIATPFAATSAGRPAEPLPVAVGDVLEARVQAGRHWRLDTAHGAVHVWIPEDYDAESAATVVFVHGYWIGVDEAWESYRLA